MYKINKEREEKDEPAYNGKEREDKADLLCNDEEQEDFKYVSNNEEHDGNAKQMIIRSNEATPVYKEMYRCPSA